METFEGKEALSARAATYEFLSGLYLTEVTAEFIEQLRADDSFKEGPLEEYAASLEGVEAEQARQDAAADFAALFLGMSALPVAPYESVYTSELQLLMQEARDEVVAFYREHGFACTDDFSLPEDHAGVELQFMARLCRAEAEAIDACDATACARARAAQQAFLRGHLLNWMPRMCEDVAARAKTGLYRGLADMTHQFLELEREELLAETA